MSQTSAIRNAFGKKNNHGIGQDSKPPEFDIQRRLTWDDKPTWRAGVPLSPLIGN